MALEPLQDDARVGALGASNSLGTTAERSSGLKEVPQRLHLVKMGIERKVARPMRT